MFSLRKLEDMEYQVVRLRGRFEHDKELHLGPRTLIQPKEGTSRHGLLAGAPKSGYLIITPFKLEGREYVK